MKETASTDPPWLHAMVRLIVDEVQLEKIVLFGSRARGETGEDSDVDLLIVEAEPFSPERPRRLEAGRLYRRLAGFGMAKDLLLYSRDEVAEHSDDSHHVVARALREGRVLYGRPSPDYQPGPSIPQRPASSRDNS